MAVFEVVDLRGVEPRTRSCHDRVFPLYYRPDKPMIMHRKRIASLIKLCYHLSMRKYSKEIIANLKKLRKSGHSISQLMDEFSIPKTTVWHHIQGISIKKEYIALIRSKQGGSKIRKQKDLERAEIEAETILENGDKYLISILAMLHWTEGDRKHMIFTNTNSEMVKLYMHILKECFNINKDRVHIIIRYFTGMSKNKCLNFWASETGIPQKSISMYYNDGGRRGRTKFGICRILVKKGGYLSKVVNFLIQKITNEIIAPVAQLEEQSRPKGKVVGSIPAGGTIV